MLPDEVRVTVYQTMDSRLSFLQIEGLHPVVTQRDIVCGKQPTAQRLHTDAGEDSDFGQRESAGAGGAPTARII